MRVETFFEKFELLADAPNAVAKIRELVLQLAFQGKLTDQILSDEPGGSLLQRIQEAKNRGRKLQEPNPVTDEPFAIPKTWIWTRLGEVGDWGSGSTPSRDN